MNRIISKKYKHCDYRFKLFKIQQSNIIIIYKLLKKKNVIHQNKISMCRF